MPKKLFAKGNSGRPKGSRNKVSADMRMILTTFVRQHWPVVEKRFNKLSPSQQANVLIKILPYTTPTFASVNMSLSAMSEEDLQVIIMKLREDEQRKQNERSAY